MPARLKEEDFLSIGYRKGRLVISGPPIRKKTNSRNKEYARYGGSGISVSKEFSESYETFLAYIGRRPTPQHSLDRIDGTKGYERGNIRWASPVEQSNNRKSVPRFMVAGQSLSMAQLGKIYGVSRFLIRQRIGRGWTIEEALFTKPGEKRKP